MPNPNVQTVNNGTAKKTMAGKETPPSNKTKSNASKKQSAGIQPKTQFPVVGIGSSAGGLEALEVFFTAMPPDSGIAFVLVSHLDPSHASILPELIQKKTTMRVWQVADNMKVVPNQVFIIPPNREMSIFNGTLQLLEMRRPRGVNLPIDTFLRSLAQDQLDKAIGIILSGTGTDGTLGVKAIKGEAGMVMAQDRASAKYDGMPASAIATGLIDYVLAPEKMPEQLISYVRHQGRIQENLISSEDEKMLSALQKIFVLLRSATGHDFSLYKKNTICRRIERRMHVHQIDLIDDYVRYLQDSDHEASILFKELLIGVTSFFRDSEAFESLKEKYLADFLKNKADGYSIRIWVPGCSTGEEAYSIAIIIQEYMEAMGRHFEVQIFATDLDEEAINIARAGIYPESISADVSQDRLRKFFSKSESHFQIKKNVREILVFAPQNVIKDPPFTKLDMICCRNLLIYFGPELQKKLLPIFHYSLKRDGILFLGSSETIGQSANLFVLLDKKWKIYKRHPSERAPHPVLDFPTSRPVGDIPQEKDTRELTAPLKSVNTISLLKAILSQSDLPPSVVIDDKANIIYIHGRTGRFLEPAEGETSINILEMARPGLKAGLTRAIRKMAVERRKIIIKGLQVKVNGGCIHIDLVVRPLSDFQIGHRGMMLVMFDEVASPKGQKAVEITQPACPTKDEEVKRLEDELQYTRENLQTTIEELEASNEELKSTNEELQSTNEELQSTNEELETSKEELQSLNEESATVNSELQNRIDELVAANDDIKNLLDATEIATLFLDMDLKIRRFTAKTTKIFPLTFSDIGRPIRHFTSSLENIDLHQCAEKVLDDLEKQTVEVVSNDGTIYRLQLRPYRTVNNVIDGVVITFEDITDLKRLLDMDKRLVAIVKDSSDAITLQDLKGNILAWNKGAEKLYGYTETEALAMNITDLLPPQKQDEFNTLLSRLKEEPFIEKSEFCVTERLNKNKKTVPVWFTVTRLLDEKNRPAFIATTERDLRKLTKDAIRHLTGADHGKG